MSETPPDVGDPGYVQPGAGQQPAGPPDPDGGDQNRDYPNPDDKGVDDETAEKAQG